MIWNRNNTSVVTYFLTKMASNKPIIVFRLAFEGTEKEKKLSLGLEKRVDKKHLKNNFNVTDHPVKLTHTSRSNQDSKIV